MANLIYRETDVAPVRAGSTVKADKLTYAELDGNFKLIDDALLALKQGGVDDASLTAAKLEASGVTAGAYGTTKKVAKLTVNNQGLVIATEEVDIDYSIKQVVTAIYTDNTNITTIIPLDNTKPQNTEGTEILSLAITPTKTTSKLLVEFDGMVGIDAGGTFVVAVFDAGTDALGAKAHFLSSTDPQSVSASWILSPGVITEVVYKIRVGPGAAGTIRMNGTSSAGLFGGAAMTTLRITEI